MNNNLFFLIISSVSICFTIIVICNGPVINGIYRPIPYENCKKLSDIYDHDKEAGTLDEASEKSQKKEINKCKRNKAMYGLEYSSLIMDIFFSFVCCLLGFLNYYGVTKGFEKIIGIIGLASGVICFIMTLVYICYSGFIFTNEPSGVTKLDKDGLYAELKDGVYNCIFYDSDDSDAVYATYSELGKKQYNYNKDNYFLTTGSEIYDCVLGNVPTSDTADNFCTSRKTFSLTEAGPTSTGPTHNGQTCEKLYSYQKNSSIGNKYNYDRWVTSIIFGVFVIACSIGLALFGFLIFKSDGSNGHTPV
jgi:hypothetical protein